MESCPQRKAVLVGVAGSYNAFSLSLYNLKAFVNKDTFLKRSWDLEIIQNPLIDHLSYEKELRKHVPQLLSRKPDVIALSCYMWNIKYFSLLTYRLKTEAPNIKIVIGGPEISRDFVLDGKFDDLLVNYCISGEGEKTFYELLLYLTTGTIEISSILGLSYRDDINSPFKCNKSRPPFPTLDSIPSPYLTGVVDDSILFRNNVEANLETQRGCNLRCSYCVYHKDMPRISYTDVRRTIDEVRFVINKGVKRIRFVDANFSSKLHHAKAVMDGLIENRFEARLMFELIPGFIDEELAQQFYDFNRLFDWNDITLGVGVQTINFQVLKSMRRAVKLARFERTFHLLQKYDIFAKIDLIIGLPGENIESIEQTLEYMMDHLEVSHNHLLCCHLMRGLPGTELLNIAKETKMVFTSELEPHEFFESPTLPRENLLRCLRRTAVIFRLVNHTGWTRREFVYDQDSGSTNIRDVYYETRRRLKISHIQLIDLIIEELLSYLPEDSYFVQERFPHAETWWWSMCKREIPDKWLLAFLMELQTPYVFPNLTSTASLESTQLNEY